MKRAASILIVEDSLTQAKRLERLLAENGYTVRVARNGIEGLAAAAEKKPSVVITDVMMPEMDGFEMCRCIKNDGALRTSRGALTPSPTRRMSFGASRAARQLSHQAYEGDHLRAPGTRSHQP